MSASLVGSEMCIRDRQEAALAALLPYPQGAAAAPWQGVRAARARQAPVSYTHLTLPTICSV
eukprot:9625327-Alexandrium_andersonii.AAC.1